MKETFCFLKETQFWSSGPHFASFSLVIKTQMVVNKHVQQDEIHDEIHEQLHKEARFDYTKPILRNGISCFKFTSRHGLSQRINRLASIWMVFI